MMNTVIAMCTGIQNRCKGTPLPVCMIENDDGGDLLHIGIKTECSKMPPPSATANEKQSRISDHWDTRAFMSLSPPSNESAAAARASRAPGAASGRLSRTLVFARELAFRYSAAPGLLDG